MLTFHSAIEDTILSTWYSGLTTTLWNSTLIAFILQKRNWGMARLSSSSKVAELLNGGARIWMPIVWPQSPGSKHHFHWMAFLLTPRQAAEWAQLAHSKGKRISQKTLPFFSTERRKQWRHYLFTELVQVHIAEHISTPNICGPKFSQRHQVKHTSFLTDLVDFLAYSVRTGASLQVVATKPCVSKNNFPVNKPWEPSQNAS